MEKQMKAERERREQILRAEGEKNSTILVAEGKKQAMILDAEAQKQRQILLAEAEKEARIRAAEGEAEAILKVQEATAESIKKINEADPSDKVIAIKSLEAFEKAADGKATKIIIPSEIQSLAGLAASVKALVTDEAESEKNSFKIMKIAKKFLHTKRRGKNALPFCMFAERQFYPSRLRVTCISPSPACRKARSCASESPSILPRRV